MIDRLPLDAFDDTTGNASDATGDVTAADGTSVAAHPADEHSARALDAPAETGYWSCQWCSERVPFDAPACPACGGSLGRDDLPPDPDADLARYFTERSGVGETLARFYVEGYGAVGGVADRRETYQRYFEESLRRQTLDAALPAAPVAAEPERLACRWCDMPHEPEQVHCAGCGTRLPPRVEQTAPAAPERCQWCQAKIDPGVATCQVCAGAIGDPNASVAGLTDLTAVEKAAEHAFQQAPPIRAVQLGIGADIHRVNRLRKTLFGKRD